MTQSTARVLRNITLLLVLLIIGINLLGMLELIPKVARPMELNLIAIALIFIALAFRRRSEGPRA